MDELQWQEPEAPKPFPTGKDELFLALFLGISCFLTANFTMYGGFNLGFAIGTVLCVLIGAVYLLWKGCRPGVYSLTVLALCLIIAAGFGRSDDGFVKYVLAHFLFLGINLGLCLLAGKNRFCPGRFQTLGDSFCAFFGLGFGKLSPALRGLGDTFRNGGRVSRSFGAVLLGLCIAFPVLLMVVPLLISADAAFDGLVAMLPEFDLWELLGTVFFGGILLCVLYARATGLYRQEPAAAASKKEPKGLSVLTVGTVLAAVCAVYLAYLISQLAYFAGGFSGLLPEEYTLAEYARRGFFEMALLCAINLGVIAISLAVVKKEGVAPLALRLMCLFVGLISLFLVTAASAKMFLYIDSYGLTRLRLLTQIVMLFLAVTTVTVMVWLFVPKLPYMKVVVLAALILGAAVIWLDVDGMVAGYNVSAYLDGRLETIDLQYLTDLGSGAIPQIAWLGREGPDPQIARIAREYLEGLHLAAPDLRGWNWALAQALGCLPN